MRYLFCSLLILGYLNAQEYPVIATPTIIPAEAKPDDELRIVTLVSTIFEGNRISKSVQTDLENRKIFLQACYYDSPQPANKTYLDTFYVGKLALGTYALEFTASISDDPGDCQVDDSNTLSTFINISSPSGLSERNMRVIPVHPVPSGNRLWLHSAGTINFLTITSLSGEVLKTETYLSDEGLDLTGLETGIYFIIVHTEAGTWQAKFIKTPGM